MIMTASDSLASGSDLYRPLVQLVERRSPKPKVGGSSPSWPAIINPNTENTEVS